MRTLRHLAPKNPDFPDIQPIQLLGVVSVAAASVALLAANISIGGLVDWVDHRVQIAFLHVMSAPVTSVMEAISWFGGRGSVYAALLICLLLLLRHEWTWCLTLALAAGSHDRVTIFLKALVHRPRPHLTHPLVTINDYSFPSGHVLAATLIYGWLAIYALYHVRRSSQRMVFVGSCILVIVLVGVSRMYLQVHYFSDVLAGGITGAACLFSAITFAAEFRSIGRGVVQELAEELLRLPFLRGLQR
jgi:membrane-associated phospholipid phosphatase